MKPAFRLLLRCGLLGLILPTVDCGRDSVPYSGVILITIDSLRADHLGCYGYDRDTSPRLDELARRSVRFERAVVPTPRSTQALASLMTGMTPAAHQVRRLDHRLLDEHFTMAERFEDSGFSTAAFVSIPFFVRPAGFDQGFGKEFEHHPRLDVRADRITDEALAWLDGREGEPFFLWLHYHDPHLPYYPPEPFRDRFGSEYQGMYEEYFHFWPVDQRGKPKEGMMGTRYFERKGLIQFGESPLSPRENDRGIALYDGEVAFADQEIGRLLNGLSQRDLDGETVLLVTSNHGESLGEHDHWFVHGETLFDQEIRVPLLLHVPGNTPAAVTAQVGLIDVAPTLLDLCSLDPLPNIQGRSLAAATTAAQSIGGRAYLAESGEPQIWRLNSRFAELIDDAQLLGINLEKEIQAPSLRLRALTTSSGLKVILDPLAIAPERFRVFNYRDDPHETTDVSKDLRFATEIDHAMKALNLIQEMQFRLYPTSLLGQAEPDSAAFEADPDTARLLQEAGYVGGR